MKRRIHLTQFIPDGPPAAFQVCPHPVLKDTWHVQIRDAIVGDYPEFVYPLKPSVTELQVACAGAGECNEARGCITVTRFEKGMPTRTAIYASNGRMVYRVWPDSEVRALKGGAP